MQVATTTSLASRIAALNCDFGDKLLEADESQALCKEDGDGGDEGIQPSCAAAGSSACGCSTSGEEDNQASLEEIVRLLAAREPPLQVHMSLGVI